jgi:hypothetical protein
MIHVYRMYVNTLDELFVIAKEVQKCTDPTRLPHLIHLQTTIIEDLKVFRSILNQKESELFVNGEDYKVNFN